MSNPPSSVTFLGGNSGLLTFLEHHYDFESAPTNIWRPPTPGSARAVVTGVSCSSMGLLAQGGHLYLVIA